MNNELFTLIDSPHKDLFTQSIFPWEALDQLSSYLKDCSLGTLEGAISKDAILINSEMITIGHGSVVEAGAMIVGPCVIGRNCQIRHGAYLRGNVLLGDGCVVGHCSEIKESIFFDGAKAPHFNYVGDSILGKDVNLGAGVKCANMRLDKKEVMVLWEGESISSKRNKLGALIGDGAQAGCNGVLNPGTIVERGAFCPPCRAVSGYVKAVELKIRN